MHPPTISLRQKLALFPWINNNTAGAGSWVCDYGGPERRRLTDEEEVSEVVLSERDWQAYKNQCTEFEYKLSLLVERHLMIVASPEKAEAIQAGCNPLMLHAKVNEDGFQEKEAITVASAAAVVGEKSSLPLMNAELDFVKETLRDDAIALGSFLFTDIAYAYDHAEANAFESLMDYDSNDDRKKYDIVMNNCGGFVKNFGALLGIEESDDKLMIVAQNLLKHGGEAFVGMIRTSKHLSALVANKMEEINDLELVRRLVERAPF